MPDYQAMYVRLLMATEDAINILIDAQRECEGIYINSPEPEIRALPLDPIPQRPKEGQG